MTVSPGDRQPFPANVDDISDFMSAGDAKLRELVDGLLAQGQRGVLEDLYTKHGIRGKRLTFYTHIITGGVLSPREKAVTAEEIIAAHAKGMSKEHLSLLNLLAPETLQKPQFPINGNVDEVGQFMMHPLAPSAVVDDILFKHRRDVLQRLYEELDLRGAALDDYTKQNGGTADAIIELVDKLPRPEKNP